MGALTHGTLVGRWAVEGLIAHGGQATVYRGRHASLGRPAAVKVFHPHVWADPAFRVRFRRECDALVALEHPHVIPVYDAGEHDGRGFLVMRLARGGSLADRLERGPMDPAQAAAVLAQVASALDAAHAAGRLHRDVKPGNVLLEGDGHAWLADFGVARRMAATTPTGEGEIVGTMGYLAPEVIAGAAPTPAADRYALGVVAFEAVTGRRPFPDEDVASLLWAHVHRPAPRASTVRPGLSRGVDRALAAGLGKDPARRPAAAAAQVALLARAAPALPAVPGPPPATTPRLAPTVALPRRARRPRGPRLALATVAAGAVLLTGSLVALGVVVVTGHDPAAPAAEAPAPPPRPAVPTPAGEVTGVPATRADTPGLPAGRPASAAGVDGVRVAAVAGAPGTPAREAVALARAELAARGFDVRPLEASQGSAPIGLIAVGAGDVLGLGEQWALLLVTTEGGGEADAVAVMVHGTGWDVARYAERLAASRPGGVLAV
ncbi:MAG: serine/threonine protein kinase [Thermoleophilia bacterium]|nr:serine/threonine protein kinase [Thermoleophilia bacterium]